MKTPELTPMTSSVVRGYHYDPEARALTIEFPNGSRHVFDDVGAEKFEAFRENPSPGSYFNSRIRGYHSSRKVG